MAYPVTLWLTNDITDIKDGGMGAVATHCKGSHLQQNTNPLS